MFTVVFYVAKFCLGLLVWQVDDRDVVIDVIVMDEKSLLTLALAV